MAKAPVKKHSTFIDMTAMSDVTVLLLTFFMLTSTFVKKEPITVTTPASVSEIKVPETNSMTILVDEQGKIFLSMDNMNDLVEITKLVGADYGVSFTESQMDALRKITTFGVPITKLPAYLDLTVEQQDKFMAEQLEIPNNPNVGIPADTLTSAAKLTYQGRSINEFQNWIRHARAVDLQDGSKDLELVIKADRTTRYEVVKNIMNNLRDLRENRYLLVTSLRASSSGNE
ncbi:MAG: biopolymer transporter ExbD [Bacteroidales bacterium]|jgi:biopolymer transport protein ExbD|nr:biopolymer transporter ExbD [Bacteroidales bacterium]